MYVCSLLMVEIESELLWNSTWKNQTIDCGLTHWTHIPKTSSMFCLSVQHTCCPVKYEQLTAGITISMLAHSVSTPQARKASQFLFGYNSSFCYNFYSNGYAPLDCKFSGRTDHVPLSATVDLKKEMGLAIIREPKSRVVSAFLDAVHGEGFHNKSEYWLMREKMKLIEADKNLTTAQKNLLNCQMYASHPFLLGIQVKQLTGGQIIDFSNKDDSKLEGYVDQAIDRLRQFFFVGVFDEYIRSMKLFHELANVGKFIF